MKRKLLLPILISILFYNIGFAQTQNNTTQKNKLEFSTGYNVGALKNLQYAPIARYDYNGLVYKLGYKRTSKKQNLFEVQLDYLESELKTDLIPSLNLDYSKIGLNISFLKKVYAKNSYSLHLGLHSQSNFSIYAKSNNYRLITNQSFGVASRFSYQINKKQRLSSKLIIPMVLFRFSDSYANLHSLNRYQSVLFNIDYNYSLSKHFDMKFGYDFNYERLQIPNAFREVQYQLNVGINYKF